VRTLPHRFNPRLPGGRRPYPYATHPVADAFQSTPSGGKATEVAHHLDFPRVVSIHAFRGEGDSSRRAAPQCPPRFNPRLPGGRRRLPFTRAGRTACFNPRLPGGRRLLSDCATSRCGGFNPRLPGGRRRAAMGSAALRMPVSIHAFRGEGDQSRSRLRLQPSLVSIHAFRGEGD